MPVEKKKISELTLSDNLKGLYTIGVKLIDGVQTSVKIGLEYIQTAYENVLKATQDAINATKNAITATSNANTAASNANIATTNANKATDNAITATNNANTATKNTITATDNANTQADRAKQFADHQPYMGDNGNWWKWDEALQKYVDTGILAKGGVLYPTFTIDTETMELIMHYQDDIAADMFGIDNEGYLTFNPK